MKVTSLLIASIVSIASAQAATTITQWTFNGSASGTDVPSTGVGTISNIVVTNTFANGAGSSDPALTGNSGYNTTGYPLQSVGSGTAGIGIAVSTVGFTAPAFTSLEVSFDLRLSNASSRWYRADYTTNGGTTWTFGTPTRLGVPLNVGDTWFNGNVLSIADPAALNNAAFGARIVSVFSPVAFTQFNNNTAFTANTAYEVARNTTSSYAGSGTWRFDMVTVTAVPEPSSALLGGLGALALIRRRRK